MALMARTVILRYSRPHKAISGTLMALSMGTGVAN